MIQKFRHLMRAVRQRRNWFAPVFLGGVAAFGVFAFLAIADEVAEGEIRAFDQTLLLAMRDPLDADNPLGPSWLEETALEITALGGYPVILLLLLSVTGFLLVQRRYGAALYGVAAVGTGALMASGLKMFYDRPRPDMVAHLDVIHTASFPSGHATVGTIAYLTLAALAVRFVAGWRARSYCVFLALFFAFLVGVSRVYLGVHWPSDVLAGWALGVGWACLAWLAASLPALYRASKIAR